MPLSSHELGHCLPAGMGQFDKALAEAQESVRLTPDSDGYANIAGLYVAL